MLIVGLRYGYIGIMDKRQEAGNYYIILGASSGVIVGGRGFTDSEGASALVIPRSRFAPVKTTNDFSGALGEVV